MGLLAASEGRDHTDDRQRLTQQSGGQSMDIKRNGSRPSTTPPEAYFTGSVRVEPVFQVGDPVRLNGGSVTFEPGARTAGIPIRSARR